MFIEGIGVMVKSAPGCTRVLIEGTEMMVDSARLLIDVLHSDQHCTVHEILSHQDPCDHSITLVHV